MITPPDLFAALMARDYTPADDGDTFVLAPADQYRSATVHTDDGQISVYGLEGHGVCWTATLTPEAPVSMLEAILREADAWVGELVTCDLTQAPAHWSAHPRLANCRHPEPAR